MAVFPKLLTLPGTVAVLAALVVLSVVAFYVSLLPPHKRGFFFGRRYVMPPGPKGIPVFGSLLGWLKARNGGGMVPWLQEQARYGEMTTLSMGPKTWVLLNSSRVVNELIAKRAALIHERPHQPIAGDLVSRGTRRVFLQPTKIWRPGRQLMHGLVMGASSKDHGPLVERASTGLLAAYLDDPANWYAHNYRYPLSVMHRIVVDGRPLTRPRAELDDLQRVTSTFLTSINSCLADFFVGLACAVPRPLQLWRPRWERIGRFHVGVFRHWWENVFKTTPYTSEKKSGSGADEKDDYCSDFVRSAVRAYEHTGSDEQAMFLVSFVMSAGSDNPRMSLNAFIMACLAHPDATTRRAREDLDRLCGDPESESGSGEARLPVLDDLPNLPYITALAKEVLRWRPVVPLIPQRVLVQDLDFEGCVFPAGTEFLVNSMAVCSDAAAYDRPGAFRPERWLPSDDDQKQGSVRRVGGAGDGAGVAHDLWQFAFSAGRRSCVGYKLAQKELCLAIARLLYCFDVTPRGRFDDTRLNAFEPGEPFPVKATVRGPGYERLIREEVARRGPEEFIL